MIIFFFNSFFLELDGCSCCLVVLIGLISWFIFAEFFWLLSPAEDFVVRDSLQVLFYPKNLFHFETNALRANGTYIQKIGSRRKAPRTLAPR